MLTVIVFLFRQSTFSVSQYVYYSSQDFKVYLRTHISLRIAYTEHRENRIKSEEEHQTDQLDRQFLWREFLGRIYHLLWEGIDPSATRRQADR